MKKLKEVYRLKFEFGYSNRTIAQSVGVGAATVSEYLNLFKVTGLSWADIQNMDGAALEQVVYCHPIHPNTKRPKPDWSSIHLELKRKGVTLQLLWREYRNQYANGLGYTQFCKLYRTYQNKLEPVMRFVHKTGEKTFVDYSGLTMEWIDPKTGEIHQAEIFVGCLGASDLIYAKACASQTLPDWIAAHINMFEAFGGVTEMLVPDNLKSGVDKANRYDPDLNQTYAAFAQHYKIAIVPTRRAAPRDKAKVEKAVQCIQREVIAPLRHQTFTSLEEINQAIVPLLKALNTRPMQHIPLSRQQQFESLEKPVLKPLPIHRFEIQTWKKAKVHKDYHISIHKHFYSVPYGLIGKTVEVCVTQYRVEVLYLCKRIAIHQRDDTPYRFTTLEKHMPPQHRYYLEQEKDVNIKELLVWAKQMGEASLKCVDKFFQVRPFPQQGIRAVLGLKRLAQRFGQERFERACQKALNLNRYRLRTIEEILKHELGESQQLNVKTTKSPQALEHFRGARYYQ